MLSKCKECGKEISRSAKTCPHCGAKGKSGCLRIFVWAGLVFFVLVCISINEDVQTQAPVSAPTAKTAAPQPSNPVPVRAPEVKQPQLRVLSWTWKDSISERFVEVVGEVQNISGGSLKGVFVIARFYSEDHQIVATEKSLIEYQPLDFPDISPFSIMVPKVQSMDSARISFTDVRGRVIPHEVVKK